MEIKCRETKLVHIIQNRKSSFPSYVEISIMVNTCTSNGKKTNTEGER